MRWKVDEKKPEDEVRGAVRGILAGVEGWTTLTGVRCDPSDVSAWTGTLDLDRPPPEPTGDEPDTPFVVGG